VGSDLQGRKCYHICFDFNPRSPVGSDTIKAILTSDTKISIHAPPWGATYKHFLEMIFGIFQSTLPRGERHRKKRFDNNLGVISIHAPPWGATFSHICIKNYISRFQSTLPRGERPDKSYRYADKLGDFNPRSPVGSDVMHILHTFRIVYFNPRSPVGSDRN